MFHRRIDPAIALSEDGYEERPARVDLVETDFDDLAPLKWRLPEQWLLWRYVWFNPH